MNIRIIMLVPLFLLSMHCHSKRTAVDKNKDDSIYFDCHPTVVESDTSNSNLIFLAFLSYGTSGDNSLNRQFSMDVNLSISPSDTVLITAQCFGGYCFGDTISDKNVIRKVLDTIHGSKPFDLMCIKGVSESGGRTGGVGYVFYFRSIDDTNSVQYDCTIDTVKNENLQKLRSLFLKRTLFRYVLSEIHEKWSVVVDSLRPDSDPDMIANIKARNLP